MEFKKRYEIMQTETVPSADLICRTITAAEPKTNHRLLHFRTVILTTVLLVILTCVFSLMVFAEKIPFIDNILDYLKQNRFPQSDTVTHGAIELYTESHPEFDTTADFRITETYCDGTVLVVSVAAEANVTKEAVHISPIYNIAINDTFILDDTGNRKAFSDAYTNLYRSDGDLFLGSLAIDISDMDTSESFTLTVDPIDATAVNPYLQIQTADAQPGQYVPKSYTFEHTWMPRSVSVTVNTGVRSEYSVEQTIENFTLHKVTTTPGFTYLDITQPDGRNDGYYYTVTNQSGKELNPMPHFAAHSNACYYDPLPLGTTEIAIHVYYWNDTTEPVGTISVPVNEGYETQNLSSKFVDHKEVVYDPPLETQTTNRLPCTFFSPQKGEHIVQFADTLRTTVDQPRTPTGLVLNSQAYADITLGNMQVYETPSDADIAEDDLYLSEPYETIMSPFDSYKFVTVDVHIENYGLIGTQGGDYQREIQAYENNDGSASIFYIDQYVSAVSNIYEEGIYDPDYAYFSHHMNGPTNYHHFAMNSFDSRDFTVGFFVDDRLLASGEWYIYTKTSRTDIYIGSNSRMEQGYFDMPAYLTH